MRITITIGIAIALLFSGIFAVTSSTLLQSITVIIVSFLCLLACFCKPKVKVDKPTLVITIVGFMYFFSRALLSPVYDLGVSDLFLLIPAAGMFFLAALGYVSRKHFFWLLMGVIVFLSVLNVLTFIPVVGDLRDSILPFATGNSQSGMYNHRNFCSNFLMMGVLVSATTAVFLKQIGFLRIVLMGIAISGVVGLVFSSARGGFLGLIAGLGVIVTCMFLQKKASKVKVISLVVLTISLIGIVSFAGLKMFSLRKTTMAHSTEFGDRKAYFAMAIDQVIEEPIVGSGSMSYSYLSYLNWGDFGSQHIDHVWVHNEFLQVLTDYGLVGLIFVSLLYFCCCKSLTKLQTYNYKDKKLPNQIVLKIIGFTILIGFSFNSLVSFPAHAQPNFMVFTFALVLMLTIPSDIVVGTVGKLFARGVLILIGLTGLFLGGKEYRALTIYSEYGMYVDNSNWQIDDDLDEKLEECLRKVVDVSPTYLRYERLSAIYIDKSDNSTVQSDEFARQAMDYSLRALDRNSYSAVALANLASSQRILKNYTESNQSYTKLSEVTYARQKFFHTYIKWAAMTLEWAKSLEHRGILVKAEKRYADSWTQIHQASHRPEVWWHVMTEVLANFNDLQMKTDNSDAIKQRMQNLYDRQYKDSWTYNDEIALRNHSLILSHYANYLFLKRKPEEALKWFYKADKYFKSYTAKHENRLDSKMALQMQKTLQVIKLLETAQIKPAK